MTKHVEQERADAPYSDNSIKNIRHLFEVFPWSYHPDSQDEVKYNNEVDQEL